MRRYKLTNLSLKQLKTIQFALDSHASEQRDTGFKYDARVCEHLIKRIDNLLRCPMIF